MCKSGRWLITTTALLSWHASWAQNPVVPSAATDGRMSSIDMLGDIWCLSDAEFDDLVVNLDELRKVITDEGFCGVLWDPCLYRKYKATYLRRLDDVLAALK